MLGWTPKSRGAIRSVAYHLPATPELVRARVQRTQAREARPHASTPHCWNYDAEPGRSAATAATTTTASATSSATAA
jgi:hypothetical protein